MMFQFCACLKDGSLTFCSSAGTLFIKERDCG